MTRRSRNAVAIAVAVLAAALLSPVGGGGALNLNLLGGASRKVVLVGSNWDATVQIAQAAPDGTLTKIASINTTPDYAIRMAEIVKNPVRLAYFYAIRTLIGENHNQFVDDVYAAPDGKTLIISRPSFADVVWLDITTRQVVARFPMEGYRADHMGVSPDGSMVAVSDSTAKKAHILSTTLVRGADGKLAVRKLGEFPSGDTPHENTFSADGTKIFHASIGLVYTPVDQPLADTSKGDRRFEIIDVAKAIDNDPATDPVLKNWDMGQKLADAGYYQDNLGTKYSSAVRPMTLSPDEKTVYFQVSFFHGFVEYSIDQERVTRVHALPKLTTQPREKYTLDSAHHGIAMNPAGTKICVAGTMDDYATIVDRASFANGPLVGKPTGLDLTKPYWATPSADGKYCYVSFSGSDKVGVLSYATGQLVATLPTGDHPQRIRLGVMLNSALATAARG